MPLGRIYTSVRVVHNVDEYPADSGQHILVGVSRITKEEASHLTNHTTRLPGDEDHYVVQLDVFHQLHCLVRQIISFKSTSHDAHCLS